MEADQSLLNDLTTRMEERFCDIDSNVCLNLRETDGDYAKMWNETVEMGKLFPVIPKVLEGNGAISLTSEEHAALLRYIGLEQDMANIERRQIYIRGHRDCFSYLKMIGAV